MRLKNSLQQIGTERSLKGEVGSEKVEIMVKRSRARSPESTEFERNQRRTSNDFAATVWQWIRNRQIDGTKFRRKYQIPPYTVDF